VLDPALQQASTGGILVTLGHASPHLGREQRERFAEQLSDPTKRWKHNPKDEQTGRRFGEFTAPYEEALTATSTQKHPGTSSRQIATEFEISRGRPCSSTHCGDPIRVSRLLR